MKTSNVLLTREGSAKVADVGLATMTDYFSSATACPGTFMYVAPEVLLGRPSNTKVLGETTTPSKSLRGGPAGPIASTFSNQDNTLSRDSGFPYGWTDRNSVICAA